MNVPESLQTLSQGSNRLSGRSLLDTKHENYDARRRPSRLSRPLRLGGERRGERPSQRGQQEAAAVHYSIT